VACAALAACLVPAGCGGSRLDPGVAVPANAAIQGGGTARSSAAPGEAPAPEPGTPTTDVPAHDPALVASGLTPGTSGHDAGPGAGHAAATKDTQASCARFHNQTGITDSTITLANASDLTGPVPGIFTSAQQATRAFAAYFNATSRLCGRRLEVLGLDTRTDAGGDLQAYTTACEKAFAAVGSMAAFDSGGAAVADRCGIPDLRSQSVSDARNACDTCFGAQATELDALQNAVPDYLLARHATAARHAAMIYVNAAASVDNARNMIAVEERRGMAFVYDAAFDVAEFNYGPYVQAMKDKGVRLVQFVGSTDQAVRLARAMQGAGFRPEAFVLDPTAYNPQFLTGGSAVEGALVFLDFLPFEEGSGNREMRLYEQWLQQVSPGAAPTYFGLFAWSAARLFAEQAQALGGRLTRAALVARLRTVDNWTDHGLHAPQPVGPKRNSSCWRFVTVHDGKWEAAPGSPGYLCHGSTVVH
jgi:ABC-type branched-subunit amino acid transport system substrate-binding protein